MTPQSQPRTALQALREDVEVLKAAHAQLRVEMAVMRARLTEFEARLLVLENRPHWGFEVLA